MSSLLSWLSIANLGIGNVGTSEMSMAMAGGDSQKARSVFSSGLIMISCLMVFISPVIVCIAFLTPWTSMLGVGVERYFEFANAVLFLAVSVGVSFFGGMFSARFVAGGKAYIAIHTATARPWFDLLASIIGLSISCRFDVLAFSLMCSVIAHTLIVQLYSLIFVPILSFSMECVDPIISKRLLRLGLAFQAFPIGNALIFQGFVVVVQFGLGSTSVVLFSTARTLVRSVNQIMEFVNQVVWPEMARLIGQSDYRRAAKLHRVSVSTSFLLAVVMTLVLGIFGKIIFRLWTGGQLNLSGNLLWLFLVPIPFNALWFTSSLVHAACNQHGHLAIRYLAATSCALICSIPLTYYFGIGGTAIAAGIVDLLLVRFVFIKSLEITKDNYADFTRGIISGFRLVPSIASKWLHIGESINR